MMRINVPDKVDGLQYVIDILTICLWENDEKIEPSR